MSRKKGSEKSGGRKRGTPNKVTSDLKTWVASILDGGREKFVADLGALPPPDYIRVFTGLLNYALPKMVATSPDEVLRKEKEMMQELLLGLPEEAIDRVAKRLHELEKEEENENKSE